MSKTITLSQDTADALAEFKKLYELHLTLLSRKYTWPTPPQPSDHTPCLLIRFALTRAIKVMQESIDTLQTPPDPNPQPHNQNEKG